MDLENRDTPNTYSTMISVCECENKPELYKTILKMNISITTEKHRECVISFLFLVLNFTFAAHIVNPLGLFHVPVTLPKRKDHACTHCKACYLATSIFA